MDVYGRLQTRKSVKVLKLLDIRRVRFFSLLLTPQSPAAQLGSYAQASDVTSARSVSSDRFTFNSNPCRVRAQIYSCDELREDNLSSATHTCSHCDRRRLIAVLYVPRPSQGTRGRNDTVENELEPTLFSKRLGCVDRRITLAGACFSEAPENKDEWFRVFRKSLCRTWSYNCHQLSGDHDDAWRLSAKT